MPAILVAAIRTGLQSLWGLLAAWLLSLGITVPESVPAPVVAVVLALAAAGFTAGLHWMETRSPRTPEGRLARLVARLLMLGIRSQPTYAVPAK